MWKWVVREGKTKPILNNIETNITMHCNLNCKGCNHFAPLYSKNEGIINFDKWTKALDRLAGMFEIKKFGILGGEPLLHPRWLDFLRYARKVLPNTWITFRTNGLLGQLLEENKKELDELHIELVISTYGLNLKVDKTIFDRNFNRLETKFEHPSIDQTGSQDKNNSWATCRNVRCLALTEDSIYCCNYGLSFSKLSEYFNLNLDIKDNYINIFENDAASIVQYLNRPKDCCRYCNLEHRKYDQDWGLSKTEKSEWILSTK